MSTCSVPCPCGKAHAIHPFAINAGHLPIVRWVSQRRVRPLGATPRSGVEVCRRTDLGLANETGWRFVLLARHRECCFMGCRLLGWVYQKSWKFKPICHPFFVRWWLNHQRYCVAYERPRGSR